MSTIQKYIWTSQISLIGLLLICTAIRPGVAASNIGASNFGNHLTTVVPYILAFILSIVFLSLIARRLLETKGKNRLIGYALIGLAFLELLVLISTFPRRFAWIYSELHDGFGVALYGYELMMAGYLLFQKVSAPGAISIAVQIAGDIIGFITIIGLVHLLFIGQLIGAFGFALVFIIVLPAVIER